MSTPKRELDVKKYTPLMVGIARGVLEAVVLAAITAVIASITELGGEALWVSPVIAVIRSIEGAVDNSIDPTKERRLLGGGKARRRTAT